ncbi:uncharacterized protein B0H64DRAFT_373821 [Chaetomium fimeti]|uniref:Uncharacterized protein n=1 Tax=Chaetomium fimeti TaxID=1854472 RepID=A0AAE0LSW5_9PEZI|nr:hypothetical protein B0H64DRAFT_373821 [Chaetomium fimeti]
MSVADVIHRPPWAEERRLQPVVKKDHDNPTGHDSPAGNHFNFNGNRCAPKCSFGHAEAPSRVCGSVVKRQHAGTIAPREPHRNIRNLVVSICCCCIKQAPSMNRDVFIEGHDGFQDTGTLKELGPGLCLGLSSLAEVSMSHETWGMINMFLRVGSPVRRDETSDINHDLPHIPSTINLAGQVGIDSI